LPHFAGNSHCRQVEGGRMVERGVAVKLVADDIAALGIEHFEFAA
jgi:hypothetical protein